MPQDKDLLIVDDSEESVVFLSEILEEHGYPYRVARNGKEAIEAMRERRPDLVFLDVMMPQKGGIAVYNEMQRDPELKDVPILIITGASEATGVDMRTGEERPKESYEDDFTRRYGENVRGQLQSLAPQDFIEKPIDPRVIGEKLKELLGEG
jgi:twitching motility two-component system response regulator PilH